MRAGTRPVLLLILTGLFALWLVAALIARTSQAAFTASTENTGNSFTAGTLDLVNNGDGAFSGSTTATFGETGLVPESTGSGCIDIRYDGNAAGAQLTNVVLYRANLNDTDGGGDTGTAAQLSDDLDLVVKTYTAGDTCAEAATTTKTPVFGSDALANMPTTAGGGIDSGWQPSATGEVRAFEFAWTLGADTAADAQGDKVTVDFVWAVNSQP